MGLKAGEVKLEKHNPRWHQMFAQELEELWDYFGDTAIRISHIGSTAIDGLEAKPIIDIVVAVKDLDDFSDVSHKFTSDPNYSIKENFSNDEILIRKGEKLNRQFYIHVMDIDSKRYRDAVLFRDTLLHDEKIRNDFRDLKHVLAKKYSHARKNYSKNKADFIEATLELVRARMVLSPMLIVCIVSLVVSSAALWLRFNIPPSTHIFGIGAPSLFRIGICFGGVTFATTLIAVIILICRYRTAKKHYNKITAKTQKELTKK